MRGLKDAGSCPAKDGRGPAPLPVDALVIETEPGRLFGWATGKFPQGSNQLPGKDLLRSTRPTVACESENFRPRPWWVGKNVPVGKTSHFQIQERKHLAIKAPSEPHWVHLMLNFIHFFPPQDPKDGQSQINSRPADWEGSERAARAVVFKLGSKEP